jgi:hypothetical protein
LPPAGLPTLPIGDILDVIRQHITDPKELKSIQDELLAAQRENAAAKLAEKEAGDGPKNKYRFAVFIRGGAALKPLVAGGAFIVAVPDTDGPESITYTGEALLQRFYKAVKTHNEAPKGKRGRTRALIKTFAEAFRILKPKTIKASESLFKLKGTDPVEVIVVEKEEVS